MVEKVLAIKGFSLRRGFRYQGLGIRKMRLGSSGVNGYYK